MLQLVKVNVVEDVRAVAEVVAPVIAKETVKMDVILLAVKDAQALVRQDARVALLLVLLTALEDVMAIAPILVLANAEANALVVAKDVRLVREVVAEDAAEIALVVVKPIAKADVLVVKLAVHLGVVQVVRELVHIAVTFNMGNFQFPILFLFDFNKKI